MGGGGGVDRTDHLLVGLQTKLKNTERKIDELQTKLLDSLGDTQVCILSKVRL
jgi:hypothetical protein